MVNYQKVLLDMYGTTDELPKCSWILPNGTMVSAMRPADPTIRESHVTFAKLFELESSDEVWEALKAVRVRIIDTDKTGNGPIGMIEMPPARMGGDDLTGPAVGNPAADTCPLPRITLTWVPVGIKWREVPGHLVRLDALTEKLLDAFINRVRNMDWMYESLNGKTPIFERDVFWPYAKVGVVRPVPVPVSALG